jgi:hypothetical protein
MEDRNVSGAKIRYFSRSSPLTPEGAVMLGEPAGITKEEYRERRRSMTSVHDCNVMDSRQLGVGGFSLDREGFTFIDSPVRDRIGRFSFRSKKDVHALYYPALQQTVKQHTGCEHVFILSHLLRTENPPNFTAAYAGFAHIDFGPGFDERWRKNLVSRYGLSQDEVANLDVATINAWQPFDNPAYKNPLCLLDYSSVDMDQDTVPYVYVGNPTYQKKGQKSSSQDFRSPEAASALGALHNPKHEWYYFPDMPPSKTILFKQYDPRPDVATCTFHSSFHDGNHNNWAECPPRRSIETRLLITYKQNKAARARL